MWICSPREPWHGMCLCHIPQAFLVTAGGCLLSVYLDSRVGLSSTKQRVRSCPWLLALFRLVLNQCRGVFSHPAEWEWMWSGIKLYLTSFFFFLCSEWAGEKPNSDIFLILSFHSYPYRELKILKNGSTYLQVSGWKFGVFSVCSLFSKHR